jgi:O-antigen ligase
MNFRVRKYKTTTLVNGLMLLACAIGGPIAAFVLFTKWSESISRQIVGVSGLFLFFVLAQMRGKQTLFVGILIFLSQFLISLASFHIQDPTTIPILLSDIILLLLLLSFKEIGEKFKLDGISLTLLALILWESAVTPWSIHLGQSIYFTFFSIKALVLYIMVANIAFSDKFYRRLPIIFAAILTIQTLIAVAQYLKGGYLGLLILGEPDPTHYSDQLYAGGALRSPGTLGATNALGGYMSMLLVCLLPFVIRNKKVIYYVAFLIGLIGLYIPLSRAAWLSFVLCSTIACFQMLRLRQIRIGQLALMGGLVFITVCAVTYLKWDAISARFENKNAVASAEGRYKQIPYAWNATMHNLESGLGPGTTVLFGAWNDYEKYTENTEKTQGLRFSNQFHSSILQYFVEEGAVGGILFCILIIQVIFLTFRKYRRNDPLSTIKLAASAGAFAYCISSQFGTEINNNQMMMLFVCLMGLANNRHIKYRQISSPAQ